MMQIDMDDPTEVEQAGSPVIETPTHAYFILPVSQWPVAAQFVSDNVSPDAAFPNDPDESSVMVAVRRDTLEIEGVLCIMKRPIVDHFAAKRGAGVSYSAFHELLQAALPVGSVYYTAVADTVGGQIAADKAGLKTNARLAFSIVGVGVEGDGDAVGSANRSGRELPSSQ